jgi:hypothetical protein
LFISALGFSYLVFGSLAISPDPQPSGFQHDLSGHLETPHLASHVGQSSLRKIWQNDQVIGIEDGLAALASIGVVFCSLQAAPATVAIIRFLVVGHRWGALVIAPSISQNSISPCRQHHRLGLLATDLNPSRIYTGNIWVWTASAAGVSDAGTDSDNPAGWSPLAIPSPSTGVTVLLFTHSDSWSRRSLLSSPPTLSVCWTPVSAAALEFGGFRFLFFLWFLLLLSRYRSRATQRTSSTTLNTGALTRVRVGKGKGSDGEEVVGHGLRIDPAAAWALAGWLALALPTALFCLYLEQTTRTNKKLHSYVFLFL